MRGAFFATKQSLADGGDCFAKSARNDSAVDDANAYDSNPGDGWCLDTYERCTLRAAIEEANAYAGADTITFAQAMTIYLDTGQGALPSLAVTGLAQGEHTITLTATDSDGMTGSAAVIIYVGESWPAQVYLPLLAR